VLTELIVPGKRKLRNALSEITNRQPEPGADVDLQEWMEQQIAEVMALGGDFGHSITIETRWSPDLSLYNCYMTALGLPQQRIKCWRPDRKIQPDTPFVRDLIEQGGLTAKAVDPKADPDKVSNGDIVVYFNKTGRPRHAGTFRDGLVVSKWGEGVTHIWRHGLWEVPSDYGNRVRIFEPPTQDQAVAAYIEWAKSKWAF